MSASRVPPQPDHAVRDLEGRLDAWVGGGLIARAEADAILAFEAERARRPEPAVTERGRGAVAPLGEALGYLGGALAVAAAGIVIGRVWPDLSAVGRVAIPGVIWLVLLAAGAFLRDAADPALIRLSRVSWFFSTAALGWCVAVATADGFGLDDRWPVLWSGAAASAFAALLYLARPGSLQQLGLVGGLVLLAGGVLYGSPTAVGLAIWAIGIGWIVLGWRERVVGRNAALTIGTVAALIGTIVTGPESPGLGLWLGIATAAGLIGAGVALRHTLMLVLGALGLFQSTLEAIQRLFGRGAGGAAALLVAGVLILVVAVLVARVKPGRRRSSSDAGARSG